MSLEQKVTEACHRIEDLWHETGGHCYVSFSGGKDSTVLLALIKLCEDVYTLPIGGIPAVFSNTGIELTVTYNFVKWVKDNYYSNVQIIRPSVSFDWVLKTKGKPLKSKLKSEYIGRYQRGTRSKCVMQNLVLGVTNSGKQTWKIRLGDKDMHMLNDAFPIKASGACCHYLKKEPFSRYLEENGIRGFATGMRAGEGGARELNMSVRENKGLSRICTTVSKKGIIKKSPLIDWTDEDLEEFIDKYNVPLSDAYTKYGFRRTGCMSCPFSLQLDHDLEYLYHHEPNRYKASMHWLKDVYIAQDVRLSFDESYERERERMAREVRTYATGNVAEVQT